MEDNENWALNKLYDIICDKEEIIKNMAKYIYMLETGNKCDDVKLFDIIRRFGKC